MDHPYKKYAKGIFKTDWIYHTSNLDTCDRQDLIFCLNLYLKIITKLGQCPPVALADVKPITNKEGANIHTKCSIHRRSLGRKC
jgi:hypothetical protein